MDPSASTQPLVDGIAGTPGGLPQVDFATPQPYDTAVALQSDLAGVVRSVSNPYATAGGGIGGIFSSLPSWIWLALGGLAIAIVVVKR